MNCTDLLQGIEYEGKPPQKKALLVTQNSSKVQPGTVFVCIEGNTVDGHSFAKKAVQDGAVMVVSQKPLGLNCEVIVQDTRAAYAKLCQNYFGNPAQKLTLVAVTGTNGKTTVSSIIKQVLEAQGICCGLIGTIHSEIRDMQVPAKYTTPEAWDLNALFSRMVAAGCTHVVMEASSQALDQGRLYGLHFALGVFTNLSQDHLDYHKTMEQYFLAKKNLFSQCDALLANQDDEWGRYLLSQAPCGVKRSFSCQSDSADFVARNIQLRAGEVRFGLLEEGFLHRTLFPMPGEYSVYNALCAAGAAIMLGCDSEKVTTALADVAGVSGRCEVLYNGQFTIIRDFAHTADALENLLASLRPFAEKRMLVLFGCAGDRDAAKRPAMGQAAAKYGDVFFLTSDNPRTELPQKTMEGALEPLRASQKPVYTEPDREKALQMALQELQMGDVLVLCGKGHEDYQVLDGVSIMLDEAHIVDQWLRSKGLRQ